MSIRVAVLTVSDRAARGERADAAGPVAVDAVRALVVLPGSPRPVASGMPLVSRVLPHALEQLSGGDRR